MPWEKKRARRMLNAAFAGRLEALRRSCPAAADAILMNMGTVPLGRPLRYDWVKPFD